MNSSLIFCVSLGSLFLTSLKPGWVAFTDRVGGYAISIPGTPRTATQTVNTPAGPLQMHMMVAQIGRGRDQYGVTYQDMPALAMRRPVEVSLNGAVEGSVKSTHSRLVNCENISFHGFPGRDYTLQAPQGERLRARIILVKQRMYMITATLPGQRAANQDTDRFIRSFKLLARS